MNKKEMICYNTDASQLIGNAEKVVFPESVEKVQSIIKTSNLDVVPRGAGTKFLGGSIPENSIIVDMNKMNKIVNIDKKKNIVHVEAGISIKELNEKLNGLGFEFPFQQINNANTIGGMIATNVSNFRGKYGKIKDWIEEISFVNGRGELMKTSKVDLGDVCGMEGITGIIVNVKLKIIPKIEKSISIFQTNDLNEILSISRRLKLEKDIIMLQVFPEMISEILDLPKKYNLIIEFESKRGKIRGKEYEKILDLKNKVYCCLSEREYYNQEDSKFFFDKLKEFILYLEVNQIPYLAYLKSGIVYYFFKENEQDKKKQTIDLMRRIGGKFVTGIGIKRKASVDNFEKKIIQRVKLRHDPFGKLNKGKFIDFEAKISAGKHLEPLQRDEIEEIKPLIDEKISSDEFEKKQEKTPDEEVNEFIEKFEILDKTRIGEELKKIEKLKKIELNPEQVLLKDYEQTYESELSDGRKKRIEEFAKNVAREITNKANLSLESSSREEMSKEESEKKDENELFKINDSDVELRGKLSKEEQDKINKVMFGG